MAERKIISASESKSGKSSTKKKRTSAPMTKKKTGGLRIGALVLWLAAIGFEILAIYMLNINEITFVIIALVADAICLIIGSLLWKKANHANPIKTESKFIAFIWNQMGVIACLLAFIPFGIYLLTRADEVDAKTKKVLTALAAVLFLGSVGASIDYTPATADAVSQAESAIIEAHPDWDGTVYWTRYGKSIHIDPDCQSLTNSAVLIEGTVEEAFEAKRNDACDFCIGDIDLGQTTLVDNLTGTSEDVGDSVEVEDLDIVDDQTDE